MNLKERQKKVSNGINVVATLILIIGYLVTFILAIIWLFKLLINAKSEPTSRTNYIIEERLNFYYEGEFCYENYEPYLVKGALDTFNIPTKKIKKYCRGVISLIFITVGSFILASVFVCLGKSSFSNEDCFMGLASLFYLFVFFGIILTIVFTIILMHYYSKGDYNDFEEFSRCRYLSPKFRKAYKFVFDIKNGYQMPFALILLTEFFNFIKLIVENGPKDENN